MKKILFGLFFITGVCHAALDSEGTASAVYMSSDNVAPAIRLVQPSLLTFNAPPPGKRNCITDIAASNSNFPTTWSLYILDGQAGATAYTMIQSTGIIMEDFYKNNPLCLSPSATTYVYISSGAFKVNILDTREIANA